MWVNDAMTTVFAPAWDVKPADFQRAVEVTFLGQVWGTSAALARMRPRDRGSIVNVGSALAFIGIPLQSAYCSSKFACRGFFESTRAELLHEGSHVRLSMVHLPAVNTPQFDWCETSLERHPQPVPPIYQPEIPAKSILAAALDGRRAKVVGSWNKALVLAGRFFPSLGNQYAAIGAWDTQLTDQPISAERPDNLYHPADQEIDHGAHGAFDDNAGGFFDPGFLRSLPTTAQIFATALFRTAREKRDTLPGDQRQPDRRPMSNTQSTRRFRRQNSIIDGQQHCRLGEETLSGLNGCVMGLERKVELGDVQTQGCGSASPSRSSNLRISLVVTTPTKLWSLTTGKRFIAMDSMTVSASPCRRPPGEPDTRSGSGGAPNWR